MKNKKKIIIFIGAILIVMFVLFFIFTKNNYKTVEFGNNTIKSAEDIKDYILNISSYEADISLEVHSNKNENKYRLKQKFSVPNIFKQEVLEPNNIQGLTTIYDGVKLKIENTAINLTEIYDNYQYISSNSLCLSDFIEEYKNSSNAKLEEDENTVVMEVKSNNNGNKYTTYKKLYIDKSTLKPTKMEIEDINKKMLVYILYNEIKINSTSKEEVLAFKLQPEQENI